MTQRPEIPGAAARLEPEADGVRSRPQPITIFSFKDRDFAIQPIQAITDEVATEENVFNALKTDMHGCIVDLSDSNLSVPHWGPLVTLANLPHVRFVLIHGTPLAVCWTNQLLSNASIDVLKKMVFIPPDIFVGLGDWLKNYDSGSPHHNQAMVSTHIEYYSRVGMIKDTDFIRRRYARVVTGLIQYQTPDRSQF